MKSLRNLLLSIGMLLVTTYVLAQSAEKPTMESTPEKAGYNLLWADEFNIDGKPSERYWSHEQGFQRNQELQWYQPQNAQIKEGRLVISGKREKVKNPNYEANSSDWRKSREFAGYTASSIHTREKVTFQYGWVDVRAKIDTAKGMWPAIWTLGISRGWPANGEIDIMEYYLVAGVPTILANAAWAHENRRAAWDEVKIPFADFLKKDPEWPNKYHIWSMDWTENYIKLYIDGELVNEVDLSKTLNPDGFNPFHQPHYLLLNLAIGGNGGDPSQTPFPRVYEVDYVRIYQRE
ncbi:MAG TPA: glycoside hydrolase family 16 protein [Lunatimonas sp.]|nr:glycoside hydrolase family 16 protein [Lunatimonas sp.]